MHSDTQQKQHQGTGLLQRVKMRAMKAGVPLSATLELTENCNLGCRHCYIVDNTHRPELGLADWKKVLDQLAEQKTLMLTLTGGEPLLHDDFFDIAAYAREKAFSFVLFTNGTLVTPEAADSLRSLRPQRIEITILGGTAATHDAISGVAGSFEKAVRGTRLLIERGINVQLKATWMRANIEEAELMESLAAELGASFRTGYLLLHHRQELIETDPLLPTVEQMETMAKRMMERSGRKEMPPPPQLNEQQKQGLSPCGAGHTSFCIDARGNVTPCVAIRTQLGNLLETSVGEIWARSAELDRLRKLRINDLPECRSCRLYLTCKRCAGVAMAETGSLLGISPQACRIAHIFDGVHRHESCPVG